MNVSALQLERKALVLNYFGSLYRICVLLLQRNLSMVDLTLNEYYNRTIEPTNMWPAWWCTPVILALRSLRQENHPKFKASLGYSVSS